MIVFNKLQLSIIASKINTKNLHNLTTYRQMSTLLNHSSGEWGRNEPFDEKTVNEALQIGSLWPAVTYIWCFCISYIEMGNFDEVTILAEKLNDIGKAYDYKPAPIHAGLIKTNLLLKRFQLTEARIEAERGVRFANRYSTEMHQLVYLSLAAEAFILLKNVDKAKDFISRAERIVAQHRFIMPVFNVLYIVAKFVIDIQLLKKEMPAKDEKVLTRLKTNAYNSGHTALKKLRKYAPYRTKTFKLMGEYYWLIDKQNKAFKWWDKAIKKGEELGTRPDLARTYFEIGKSLLEPSSKHKELNGTTAEAYLEKARTMFEEMDLQWDLDELDKVMAARS